MEIDTKNATTSQQESREIYILTHIHRRLYTTTSFPLGRIIEYGARMRLRIAPHYFSKCVIGVSVLNVRVEYGEQAQAQWNRPAVHSTVFGIHSNATLLLFESRTCAP